MVRLTTIQRHGPWLSGFVGLGRYLAAFSRTTLSMDAMRARLTYFSCDYRSKQYAELLIVIITLRLNEATLELTQSSSLMLMMIDITGSLN
jgi:hypothetical protein